MALPSPVIDRLFDRLSATYGRDFSGRWEGLDPHAVRVSWAHELAGYSGRGLHAIAWALDNLPERAPNVIEFRNLCRKAPALEVPLLPEPKADPHLVREQLAKLGAAPKDQRNGKEWAHRIIASASKGLRVTPIALTMARAAVVA